MCKALLHNRCSKPAWKVPSIPCSLLCWSQIIIQHACVCPSCCPHTSWNLQDQLITSEEQRLEVSQVLLDFQLEHNHAKVGRQQSGSLIVPAAV